MDIPQPVEKYGLLLPQKQMQLPQKAIYFPREFNKVFRCVITRMCGLLLKCFEGDETSFPRRYSEVFFFSCLYIDFFAY